DGCCAWRRRARPRPWRGSRRDRWTGPSAGGPRESGRSPPASDGGCETSVLSLVVVGRLLAESLNSGAGAGVVGGDFRGVRVLGGGGGVDRLVGHRCLLRRRRFNDATAAMF